MPLPSPEPPVAAPTRVSEPSAAMLKGVAPWLWFKANKQVPEALVTANEGNAPPVFGKGEPVISVRAPPAPTLITDMVLERSWETNKKRSSVLSWTFESRSPEGLKGEPAT